jgi:hypothetical protein
MRLELEGGCKMQTYLYPFLYPETAAMLHETHSFVIAYTVVEDIFV